MTVAWCSYCASKVGPVVLEGNWPQAGIQPTPVCPTCGACCCESCYRDQEFRDAMSAE